MSNTTIQELLKQLEHAKDKLEAEVEAKRDQFNYQLNRRKVIFEVTLKRAHKQLKTTWLQYILGANPLFILTAPVIYAMIVPLMLLDLLAWLYQAICFPVYKIKRIRRRDYVVVDRHKLAYLNVFEKLNCIYCGYANGVLGYVRELAAITEQYWCPIKHASKVAKPHDRYWQFIDYGDAQGYVCDLEQHQRQAKSQTNS